jgi:hypothetical protein
MIEGTWVGDEGMWEGGVVKYPGGELGRRLGRESQLWERRCIGRKGGD